MRESYIESVTTGGDACILARVYALFSREPHTDQGLGVHYIVDLVGIGGNSDGAQVVSIVCENTNIPVCDLRNKSKSTIRDLVKYIMETAPARCAILLDTRDDEIMQKVRSRLMSRQCDLRYRRIVFCLTDEESPMVSCIHVPGSSDDKLAMLLYHIPPRIRSQAESRECFRPLSEAMVDYVLFEPRVWREVNVEGTLDDFLSTAMYHIVRHVRSAPQICMDEYPSFEMGWRRMFATHVNRTLSKPTMSICPDIHRVIPIGVSSADAMQAMQVAIPNDIQDPYAVTVKTSAVDDRCGSIAITQPTKHTIINVNCIINPRLLVEVCRELRVGHKAVINEVHTMSNKMSGMSKQMSIMEETNLILSTKLSAIQVEMRTLMERLTVQDRRIEREEDTDVQCTKSRCSNIVTGRFMSGKRQKQCDNCQALSVKSKRHKS
jgi:hypothetical protein